MKKKSLRRLNKPFEANLRALWREFKRCSQMYRPLYSDELLFGTTNTDILDEPLQKESWLAFTAVHQPDQAANEWWVWERVPFGMLIHRYWGCPDGLAEFRRLAESAAILFEEMEFFEKADGHYGWTCLLHSVARHQHMPLLRVKTHPSVRPFDLGDLEDLAEQWNERLEHDIPDYPIHMSTSFLVQSVFTSSMTLIESVLDPDSVVFTSLAYTPSMDNLLGPPEVVADEEATVISSELPVNVPPDRNVFRKITDKAWFIQFVEGCTEPERGIVDGSEGFHLIQKVLLSEKQPVSPIELYAAIPEKGIELADADDKLRSARKGADEEGMPRRRGGSGTGVFDRADPEAIRSYRNRRKELLAIIEQAQPNVESSELDKARSELEFINKELNSVANVKGQPRSFPLGTPEEAARNRVKTSWCRALALLKKSKKFDNLSKFLDLNLKTQGAQGRQYMQAGVVKWET